MSNEGQIQSHVANVIKEWRKTRGMSQAALADKVGMHQTAIAKIENNERRVDFATVVQISQVLEIPWSELFVEKISDVMEVRDATSTVYVSADNWIEDMARAYTRLDSANLALDKFIQHLEHAEFPAKTFDVDRLKKDTTNVVELVNLMREKTPELDFLDRYNEAIRGVRSFLQGLEEIDNATS